MQAKFICFLGLIVFILLAWVCSVDRRKFPWRTVWSGIALQFALGLIILKTSTGQAFFNFFQGFVSQILGFAMEGARMVFGPLADGQMLAEKWGPQNAFIFVVTVTATIIFVSAISSLLYHYGVLQLIVRGMAFVMQKIMRTSGSESLAAAANIFMGQTEAPLVVKPYLASMTRSELMALMTGGMATIAGGVLAAYVSFGISAGHLLTASVMSAPAALMIAKIMLPETEVSATAAGGRAVVEKETVNGVDALCRGASDGVQLAINVMAMLIAFVGIVYMANWILSSALQGIGITQGKPLQTLFAYVNSPFAWLMGVPAKDCLLVGQTLGERMVLNEFVGYLSLTGMKENIDPRSFTLATYAMCGFANFASIAIQIGGIGSLAPSRRADLARYGMRAMIGGILACYLTATIAGILL